MIVRLFLIPVLYLIAFLPSDILYGFSRFLAFILYKVIRYRRKVVFENLSNAFPDKTIEELNQIAKDSYRNLADRVVENIKCISISPEEVIERMVVPEIEKFDEYYRQGRSVILMIGHIGAWEYAGYRLSTSTKYKTFGIVSLVKNKAFNQMIQSTRAKMGMELIPMQDIGRFFRKPLTELSVGAFISDQSPSNPRKAYWTKFLNQETAFFRGAETYARIHNCVVLYPKIVQVKQGYYHADILNITENAQNTAPNEITERFVRLLEQQISENPADWLWSHKRWKHKPQKL